MLDPSWMFAAAVGGAIVLLTYAVLNSSAALLDPLRKRLRPLRQGGAPAVIADSAQSFSGLRRWFEPRAQGARDELQARLRAAGYPAGAAVYGAARLLLAALLPAVIVVTEAILPQLRLSPPVLLLLAGSAGMFGWLLPALYLAQRARARQSALMEGLPDALDLLVSCTEAGLGLNAALERVVEQMPTSHPLLAAELSRVNDEMRAGIDRTTALRNLAERTGLDEIRGLVSLITHSARLGTGIAGTLRIYAGEFRDRRMQRAEEIAATVGTRLVLPLVLCIFPSFFVVAIGPAVLGVIRALSGVDLPGQ